MKQFLTVLQFELNNYFKNKSFVLTTVIFAVILAAAVAVPPLIPGLLDKGEQTESQKEAGAEEDTVSIYQEAEIFQSPQQAEQLLGYPCIFEEAEDTLKEDVKSGKVKAGFLLKKDGHYTYVVLNNSMYDSLQTRFEEALKMQMENLYLEGKGMSETEITEFQSILPTGDTQILGKDSAGNYAYTYVLIFAMYLLILFYGQMIATAITTEKSNRTIEILVTSVNSNNLIFGKVAAGALAGMIQMGIFIGVTFGAYAVFRDAWGGILDFLLYIPAPVLGAYIVFGMLGYLLYAMAFGMLGALVSKTEDISKSSSTLIFLYVVSFLVAVYALNDADGILAKITSYIPFLSHNAMFIRIAMGSVQWWEIGISAALLAVSCVAAGILAAKIFRMGTLMYGNPIKLGKAIKMAGRKTS